MKNRARINISITGDDADTLQGEMNKIMNDLTKDGWKITVANCATYDSNNNVCYAGCVATKG